jgi:hypothetical protein
VKDQKNANAPTIAGPALAQAYAAMTGTRNRNLQAFLLNQVRDALWLPNSLTQEEKRDQMGAAAELLRGIRPQDELEGALCAQMVATHSAAMECFRRAMVPQQTIEVRDLNLKHAQKLQMTFAHQMELLDKRRGRSQQKVIVEHVYVEAGGQAIVGNVEGGLPPVRQRTRPKHSSATGSSVELVPSIENKAGR